MRRTVAFLVAALAAGLVLFATYEAFFFLLPVVSLGTSLGLALLGLGVLCIIACGAVASSAHRYFVGAAVHAVVWEGNDDLNTTMMRAMKESNSDFMVSSRKP